MPLIKPLRDPLAHHDGDVVIAAAGTVSLPAYTTTGDLDTGMWFPAADTIAWSVGGAEYVRLTSSAFTVKGTASLVVTSNVAVGLDLSAWSGATASIKLPASTIQSTGDLVFQPTVDSVTAWTWKDLGGTSILTIDSTNEVIGFKTAPDASIDFKLAATHSNAVSRQFGIDCVIDQDIATTLQVTGFRGGASTSHASPGVVSLLVGFETVCSPQSNGPVTSAYGALVGAGVLSPFTPSLLVMTGCTSSSTIASGAATFAFAYYAIATAKTTGTIGNSIGLYSAPQTAGTTQNLSFLCEGDCMIASNMKLFFEGTLGVNGDTYIVYDAAGATLDCVVNGQEVWNANTTTLTSLVDLNVNANVSILNGNDLRLYDVGNSNYVGWKAPALTGNQIWTLPDADGSDGDVMFTNGSGILKWGANASTRSFTFSSPSGGFGTTYAGGHYRFGSTDNDFNPSITFGVANIAYGDHIFIVAAAGGAGGTDTVIRVTGTSVTDGAVRTTADTEDLTADDAGAAGDYYETAKKWVGQVTIEKISGPDLLCNYGGAKYWDDNNENFKVQGVDVTWLGGANDANPNLILRHHKAAGWTYNAGSTPTPPTPIATMNTDYVTEIEVSNGEEGAWKRTNLSENINGSASEGTIVEIVTTSNKTFEIGNFLMRVVPQ